VNAAAGAGGSDGAVQLADKLKIFKTDNFDPDAYVQSKCRAMDEKVRNSSAPEICLQWWWKGRAASSFAWKCEGHGVSGVLDAF